MTANHKAALESIRDLVSTFLERDEIQSKLPNQHFQMGLKRARSCTDDTQPVRMSAVVQFEQKRASENSQQQADTLLRERAIWCAERERIEGSCQKLTRDLRYLQMKYDGDLASATHRYEAATAAHQLARKELNEALISLNERKEKSGDDSTQIISLNRKCEELTSINAELRASLSGLQTSAETALASCRAKHAHQMGTLQKELETLRSSRSAIVEEVRKAASRSEASATEIERLSNDAKHSREDRDRAHAALDALSGSKDEILALREEIKRIGSEASKTADAMRDVAAERDELRDSLLGWESLFRSDGSTTEKKKGSLHVYNEMLALRENELRLTKSLGESEVARNECGRKLEETSSELAALKTMAAKEKQRLDSFEHEARTLKSLLAVKDEALHRRQELLESYESNEAKPGRRSDDQRLEKEQLLEEELRETKASLEELKHTTAQNVERLEALLEKAERELAAHYASLVRGEYVPPGTKVIHMRNNPSAEAARDRRQQELKRVEELENENIALKTKLEAASCLATDKQGVHSMNKHAADGTPTKEPTSEMVNQRLKEMFRKNVEQLKSAVMSLFGFELLFSPGSGGNYNVKCRSVYSETEEQILLFQWAGTGGDGKIDTASPLQLMSTPFALQLQRDRPQIFKIYLHTFASLPLFLGEVQRYLFESTTQFTQQSS